MASVRNSVEFIIGELTKHQAKPAKPTGNDWVALPRTIYVGDGRSLVVSRAIDETIAAVADQLFSEDATLTLKYTRAEWRNAVREIFGPALARIDLDEPLSANVVSVLSDIRKALERYVSRRGEQEFAFGCSLFSNAAVQPFEIGPVRFEARLDWLARKHSDGSISTVCRRRVERAWSGKRPAKRKASHDSELEDDIRELGSAPFVCSVMTEGFGPEAGREKALIAARLAIASIALLWQTPSRALNGLYLYFDRSPRRRKVLTFIPGRTVLAESGWSHKGHGPWMKNGEWERTFSEWSDHFRVVGDVLAYVMSPSGNVARPNMMNTLAQSLLWLHEGCREPVTLMAIVKFSAALDALAYGGRSNGIRRMVNARLGMQDGEPVWRDGPTVKEAIDDIYGYGRSRTIHGRNDKLGHDWSHTRELAEQFGRYCLLACMHWTAQNPTADDPRQLSAK